MQSRGSRIEKMYLTSGNIRTIHGYTSVVSGSFQPRAADLLLRTDSRYRWISVRNSSGMGIVRNRLKSHSSSPFHTTCRASMRHASYRS